MSSRRAFVRAFATSAAAAPLLLRVDAIEEAFARATDGLAGAVLDPEALRQRYMVADHLTYLNHASIGTVPRAVHAARVDLQEACESNPWLYIFGGGWEDAREEVRARSAAFLGCQAGDVAITHNTTEGFNVLARGLPLGVGDEVLFASTNHDGASVCWRHVAPERGFSVRTFAFPVAETDGMSDADVVELYARQIRSETRVLVFPHIDNMVGLRHPLRALTAMAHQRGVEFVLVDGAQSMGMIPLDLEASGVDAYSASPHKWLQSPKGLGLLFLQPSLRAKLKPMWVTWGQSRWSGTVRVFEDYGTRDMPEVVALGDAIRFQEALGADAKAQAFEDLRGRLLDMVDATPGLRWRSPRGWAQGASLIAVEVEGRDSAEARERLYRDHGVVLRAFSGPELNALRVSPNVMNTEKELETLVRYLQA